MNFMLLLLVLLAERFTRLRARIQQDGWWQDWFRRCERPEAPWWTLLGSVLLPVLVAGLLLHQLHQLLGDLTFFCDLLIVLYSLGRGDPRAGLEPFCAAWERGDEVVASQVARRELGIVARTPGELLEQLQQRLLWQGYQGFFAVIFWYALLGPLLPLAYRLLVLTERQTLSPLVCELCAQLLHALDWVPVRLLAIAFAVVGNFWVLPRVILPRLFQWRVAAPQLLLQSGIMALEPQNSLRGEQGVRRLEGLWGLLSRAAMLWYVAFALGYVLF